MLIKDDGSVQNKIIQDSGQTKFASKKKPKMSITSRKKARFFNEN